MKRIAYVFIRLTDGKVNTATTGISPSLQDKGDDWLLEQTAPKAALIDKWRQRGYAFSNWHVIGQAA